MMIVNLTNHHTLRLLERLSAQLHLEAVVADGWTLDYVDDGGGEVEVIADEGGVEHTLELVFAVDEALVLVKKDADMVEELLDKGHFSPRNPPPAQRGWIRFVLGNDPDEVVNDYTVNVTVLDDFNIEEVLAHRIEKMIEDSLNIQTEEAT